MAENAAVPLANRASFDIRFEQRPPDDCCCPICLSVMKNPHLTSCCGRHFCQRCINRILELGHPCPVCKEEGFTTLFDRQLRNRINALCVHCPMETVGCLWRGRLEFLDVHLNVGKESGECQFISVPCPFGCEEHHMRRNLHDHMRKRCPNRHLQCQLCYQCGSSSAPKEHHPNCPNRPVICPNGCPIKVRFIEIDQHVTELCPYREVDCKFRNMGCTMKIKFKDVPRHLIQNAPEHLDYVRWMTTQLSIRGTTLEERYLEVVQNNANMEELHTDLRERVIALEGRCGQYEAIIQELQDTVRTLKDEVSDLKMSSESVRRRRSQWERFPTPQSSFSFVEGGEEDKIDLSCSFRP